MTSLFDIQTFWKEKIKLEEILAAKKSYPSMDKIFTEGFFKKCFNSPPYFIHPLACWLAGDKKPQILKELESQLAFFQKQGIEGFNEKITEITSEPSNQHFFSFLSELAVAWRFRNYKFEFLKANPNKRTPDLKIYYDDRKPFYIEVYTQKKFYFPLYMLRTILSFIDPRIKVETDMFQPLSLWDIKDPVKGINSLLHSVHQKLETSEIKNQIQTDFQIPLYQGHGFLIILEIEENSENYVPKCQNNGRPECTFEKQLREIYVKAQRGQLHPFRPNMLVIDYRFNDDFLIGINRIMKQTDTTTDILAGKPGFVDVVSFCSLDTVDPLSKFVFGDSHIINRYLSAS